MNAEFNKNIRGFIAGLQTGTMQVHNSMVVFPLFSNQIAFEGIIGLDDAFKKKCVEFKEVSESGSVPNLRAINKCENKVLIIEGQELKGAKQNRTLNTHILLPELSETIIPVSCTERGRWRYNKRNFDMTDKLVSHKLRRKINVSVKNNLHFAAKFHSNQSEVWDEIDSYMKKFKKSNSTSSYDAFFTEMKADLSDYEGKFPVMENQVGVVVFINGKLEGVELVNDAQIYKQNHDKIIKSYMIDDLKVYNNKTKNKSNEFELGNLEYLARESEMKEIINNFFKAVSESYQTTYKSTGLGYEHRLTRSKVEGNFLVYNEKPLVVHLFPVDNNSNSASEIKRERYIGEDFMRMLAEEMGINLAELRYLVEELTHEIQGKLDESVPSNERIYRLLRVLRNNTSIVLDLLNRFR